MGHETHRGVWEPWLYPDQQAEEDGMNKIESERWEGFSDEELGAMQGRLSAMSRGVSPVTQSLCAEVERVLEYRDSLRPSYRGPGVYRIESGAVARALGLVDDPELSGDGQVVLRYEDDDVVLVSAEVFERCDSAGRRAFTYVGPLVRRERS